MKTTKTMKIFYDKNDTTQQLAKSQALLPDAPILPSKLNIKLKTHSLTCLDIPLETLTDLKRSSLLIPNDKQRSIVGSVDLISEMQHQSENENPYSFSSSKPLINMIPSDKHESFSQQPWRQMIKNRFRSTNSLLTHTYINDSIVRLRRNGRLQNLQSLQNMNKLTKSKRSLFLNRKYIRLFDTKLNLASI